MLRVGDCCLLVLAKLGSTRLLRLCSRVLVTRLMLSSGAGESVRTGIDANEERTLLSLSAPASLSGASIDALFWWIKVLMALPYERGVLAPWGLFEREDPPVDEARRYEEASGMFLNAIVMGDGARGDPYGLIVKSSCIPSGKRGIGPSMSDMASPMLLNLS